MSVNDLYVMIGRLYAENQIIRSELDKAKERITELGTTEDGDES